MWVEELRRRAIVIHDTCTLSGDRADIGHKGVRES